MNVGIVCEGRTDFILLEQVVLAVLGPSEVRPLQPMRDTLEPSRWTEAGWTKVKLWCERGADTIDDELEIGALDLLILQIDGDLCGRDGLPASRPALCDHLKTQWIGPPGPSSKVVICIPAPATDAWLVAALEASPDGDSLEQHVDVLDRLAAFGIAKNQYDYLAHAGRLGEHVRSRSALLPELRRFVGKLEAARRRVSRATG